MQTTIETNHAKEQAVAQLESICDLVADLELFSAAEKFVYSLPEDQVARHIAECREENGCPPDCLTSHRAELTGLLANEEVEIEGFEFDSHFEDRAREAIQNDALSVEVRTDWYTPGQDAKPAEFKILLCTGGPAVAIFGEIGEYGEAENPVIKYQDWHTPWEALHDLTEDQERALLIYCSHHIFEY